MNWLTNKLRRAMVSHLLKAVSLALAVPCAMNAQSTPSMIQVPILSAYAGVPGSTYNGTGEAACASGTTGRLDSYGNGCPATQALLDYSYGLAIDQYSNIYTTDYAGSRMVRVVYQGGVLLLRLLLLEPR